MLKNQMILLISTLFTFMKIYASPSRLISLSKSVLETLDFLVKVCTGDSYISELSNAVRVNMRRSLHLDAAFQGIESDEPKDSVVNSCLKALPPTCTLLVMDNAGRIGVQMQGTSQQGSTKVVLQPSLSSPLRYPSLDLKQLATSHQLKKSFTAPSASMSSPIRQNYDMRLYSLKKTVQVPNFLSQELSQRLSLLEAEGSIRRFTSQELNHITNNFSPEMLIGEGGNSEVYRGNLQGGQIAAVKVLKITHWSEEDVFRELSDFGAAIVHQTQQVSADIKPTDVVRTFGYLAPEYMMYGKVDEKIDVYSYGIVLLELITGKEAIQTNQTKHESLARYLLSCGLCERLIDPYLNEDYKKEEMEIMMCVARLCLLHSSSRRPTMKTILRLFEEPE
ncbi:hypothetical protein Pint_34199 [Pistacia integerrima]|uniref:Uncharacterized protein n=1 Tax=Pistacia integerrima TaxID=434235 RepID=A0ACC0X5W2_9ROSI|nr:hypothetical protein Pint_34199 [Pistacia integerrima]